MFSMMPLTGASTSATGTASTGAAMVGALGQPEGTGCASSDATWTPCERADRRPRPVGSPGRSILPPDDRFEALLHIVQGDEDGIIQVVRLVVHPHETGGQHGV